jgi:3-dehydroquinate synthase
METTPNVVDVSLGERSYQIHVGTDILMETGKFLEPVLQQKRVVVVSDEIVIALHHARLADSLESSGIEHDSITLPAGEHVKSFKHLEMLLDRLLEMRVERGDAIVALGGGVIGDLAGFAASTLRRGVDVIQVPTTLLAQVDSSVGGKTAINTRFGKNLVGAFHQPKLVLADTETLATLPERDMRAGYAEVVKYGLIDQPDFFSWLESNGARVISGDPEATRHAVVSSCRAKARFVSADEREAGSRALLNLGHTFAHALEAEVAYEGQLMHGEAVAIGIVMAFELSTRMGLCPVEDAARVRRHIADTGLPTSATSISGLENVHPETLVGHMRQDKKVRGKQLTFILCHGIGQAFITSDVDEQAVIAMLGEEFAASA